MNQSPPMSIRCLSFRWTASPSPSHPPRTTPFHYFRNNHAKAVHRDILELLHILEVAHWSICICSMGEFDSEFANVSVFWPVITRTKRRYPRVCPVYRKDGNNLTNQGVWLISIWELKDMSVGKRRRPSTRPSSSRATSHHRKDLMTRASHNVNYLVLSL